MGMRLIARRLALGLMTLVVCVHLASGAAEAQAPEIVHFDRYEFPNIDLRGKPLLEAIDADADLDVLSCQRDYLNFVPNLNGGGFGEFGVKRTPIGGECLDLTAIELDGDGVVDVAVTGSSDGRSWVFPLRGLGDGTFDSLSRYELDNRGERIANGDFDGDGSEDLVASEPDSGQVEILMADGAGSFREPERLAVGGSPETAAVGDVNSDGVSDAVTANRGSNDLSVLLGQAGIGLTGVTSRVGPFSRPIDLALADFDSDGAADVAALSRDTFRVRIFAGGGNGTFTDSGEVLKVGDDPRAMVAADFNADSAPDLAVSWRPNLGVYFGEGDGELSRPTMFSQGPPFTQRYSPTGAPLAAGRIDEDEFVDLIRPGQGMNRYLATDRLSRCHGEVATFVGSDRGDFFSNIFKNRPVVVDAGPGVDLALGSRADDTACLGGGSDHFRAGAGEDRIWGQGGSDQQIHGNGGRDLLDGGAGDDVLGPGPFEGEHGGDTLRGGTGRDLLDGGPGNDRCDGGPNRDGSVSCEHKRGFP